MIKIISSFFAINNKFPSAMGYHKIAGNPVDRGSWKWMQQSGRLLRCSFTGTLFLSSLKTHLFPLKRKEAFDRILRKKEAGGQDVSEKVTEREIFKLIPNE